MDKNKYWGYFQLAAAMSLAGSSVIVGKKLLHLPIFFAQTISLAFALAFIIPFAITKEGMPKLSDIRRKDFFLMMLQGLCGVLLFRVFMMLALRYASAAATGIALSTTPAVLILFSVIFLKEKAGARSIAAVFLCFAGMSLLNVDLDGLTFTLDKPLLIGNLFALLSVCSEAMFTILRKKQSYSDRPLTSTAIVMFFAFIMFLPIGAAQYFGAGQEIAPSGGDFFVMFIYGAACSAIAYAFWFGGLAKVDINEAAGFTGFMPLSSVVLSGLILKERITAGHLAGMALVLAGIYLIAMKRNKTYEIKGDLTD